DADALVVLRQRLASAARGVSGLDSLIAGTRRSLQPADAEVASDDRPVHAVLVTVWRDVDSMVRATAVDEQRRFLGTRLELPLELEAAIHYELAGRTFAALPPASLAYLRVLTVRSRAHDEARLVETLRGHQTTLVRLGMIASHLGRRVVGAECEVVSVGVWPDPATMEAATGSRLEALLFEEDLTDWQDRIRLTTYDAIEIAPRLPAPSGPPIFILDGDLRIVDITPRAAATMGWEADDLVGRTIPSISLATPEARAELWQRFMDQGTISGESAWLVPPIGAVIVRYLARRDVPVPGRHAVLVHRWNEPVPTPEDLEAALRSAFPDRVD
ncbi:MAG: hypothetical protein ACRDIL_03550, partial [Candidatus Limnocylindrales bacterium]